MDNNIQTKCLFYGTIYSMQGEKDKTRYSLASKERIDRMDKEELKKKMSDMAKAKWSKLSEEERKAHALKMLNARYGNDQAEESI